MLWKSLGIAVILLLLSSMKAIRLSLDPYQRYWRERSKLKDILEKFDSVKTIDVMEREMFYSLAYSAIYSFHLPQIAQTRCSSTMEPNYIRIPEEGYGILSGLYIQPQTWDWLKDKELYKLPIIMENMGLAQPLTKEDLIRVNKFFKPGSSAIAVITIHSFLIIIWAGLALVCFMR